MLKRAMRIGGGFQLGSYCVGLKTGLGPVKATANRDFGSQKNLKNWWLWIEHLHIVQCLPPQENFHDKLFME